MNTRAIKAIRAIVVFPLLVLAFSSSAHADLTQAGPVGTGGFPQWYQDLPTTDPNSVSLQLCLNDAFCSFSTPVPGNAASRRAGFGTAWYWQVETRIGPANNPLGEYAAGVMATFRGSNATTTRRRVVNHVRIDLRRLPVNGTYTVIHPFGVNSFNVVDDGNGNRDVNFVQNVGGPRFNSALSGPVGPFLRARRPAPPVGFLGNNDLFATVTGAKAPGKNFFRIIGPRNANLGGPVGQRNVITQTRFNLMGQLQ